MSVISDIVAQIRTAIYGRDVRENIALGIETCYTDIANSVKKTDVANNLTTTASGKVLDARQGKALNDSKVSTSNIVNNLTTTASGKVLDARQGKALDDAKVNRSGDTMSDNLTIEKASDSTNVTLLNSTNRLRTAFSIGQDASTHGIFSYGYVDNDGTHHSEGKWIICRDKNNVVTVNGRASENILKTDIANDLTTTASGKVLDARQGKALNDSKVSTSNIVNNLTTTASGKVLDARQGKALDDAKVNRSGDTMSDNLTIDKPSGSTNVTLHNSTNGLRTAFSIGNDATTHGIFSYGYVDEDGTYHSDGKWLVYRYKDNIVRLNGRASENILKTDIANDLTTTASGKVLDARQGKILNDKIANSSNAVEANIHNLLDDGVTWVDGKYLDGDGTIGTSANMRYSSLIEFTHPNDYAVTFTALNELHNFRLLGYDKNGNFRRQLRAIAAADQKLNGIYSTSFAAGDCKYVRISICSFYTVHMAQTIDDKDLCVKYQNNVDTFALSERKNLLEGVGWTEYAMIGSNGAIDTTSEKAPYCRYSDLISVPSNKRYYLSSIVKVERNPGDIYIDGYNSNNTWVKRLRTIPADEQTAGSVSIESFYVPEGIASIRISLRTYHFACLSVSNDIDETVMESLYDKSTMPWVVGGINFVSGATNTNTERIRPDGWGDLGADFIRGENVKIALFVYDRDQAFVGVWNGSKLVSGVMTWFDFINMREVHKALDSLYPNFLYKITARVPGSTTPSASDGSKVYFYTRKIPYASVGSYLTWAVIGASSEYGWFDGATHPDYAWPAILARKIGNTVTNYSKGGQKLKTFITDTSTAGLAKVLSDPAKELYVITLGGNDASDTSYAIGTMADITGHQSGRAYANTVYGDYGQILDRIMAHAPNAKYILTTPPGSNYNARHLAVDNAVREIAAYYRIPYIEWEHDPFMSSNVYTRHLASNHPTKILYSGKAMAFERLFSECVAKNITYFCS